MLGPVGHLASAIAYAVRRGARREADRAAVADVHWRKRRDDLPKGLELQWLGTSGFRLSYEGHDVLIDPYLTRVPLRGLRRAAPGNWDTIAPHVGNASAILIGHTHFDHAMDAPLIARRYNAPVHGGRSLVQLMEL